VPVEGIIGIGPVLKGIERQHPPFQFKGGDRLKAHLGWAVVAEDIAETARVPI